jgi:phosphinothricin acetyltransferase
MTAANVSVRSATAPDAGAIAEIYAEWVVGSIVTFEETPPSPEALCERMTLAPMAWAVAERAGQLVGFASVSPWKPRSAYRFAVEFGVYVVAQAQRLGIGSALYRNLLERCKAAEVHTVLAGIALPNEASIAFHESIGVAHVGTLSEVGFKFGRRIDVGYWQRRA